MLLCYSKRTGEGRQGGTWEACSEDHGRGKKLPSSSKASGSSIALRRKLTSHIPVPPNSKTASHHKDPEPSRLDHLVHRLQPCDTSRKKVRVFGKEDADPSPACHAAGGIGLYWKHAILLSPATWPCCHWSARGGSKIPRRGSSCAPCFRKVFRCRQVRGKKFPRTRKPCPASMHVKFFNRGNESVQTSLPRAWA